jgi:hypothetical protein
VRIAVHNQGQSCPLVPGERSFARNDEWGCDLSGGHSVAHKYMRPDNNPLKNQL